MTAYESDTQRDEIISEIVKIFDMGEITEYLQEKLKLHIGESTNSDEEKISIEMKGVEKFKDLIFGKFKCDNDNVEVVEKNWDDKSTRGRGMCGYENLWERLFPVSK
ncbi:MAG: hypothetical protein LBI69_04585 [Puniceicoccales bacterium]|nr:hypothetical protein [Puniceicoccales bacterium]